MAHTQIGFIGIGQMGMPMIRNLLRANLSVTGFDLNPLVAEELKSEIHFELFIFSVPKILRSLSILTPPMDSFCFDL